MNHPSALYHKSSASGHKTQNDRRTFDWTQQIIEVLVYLIGAHSQVMTTWKAFKSENGDIGFFSTPNSSSNKVHLSMRDSLCSIQETFEKMEMLNETLQRLNNSCQESAQAVSCLSSCRNLTSALTTDSSNFG